MGYIDDPTRQDLHKYVEIIKNHTNIIPETLFEAGCKDGQDSVLLSERLGIKHKNIHLFEPNELLFSNLKKRKNLKETNIYDVALFNTDGNKIFNQALDSDDGRSSLLDRPNIYENKNAFKKVSVSTCRLDTFMEKNNIKTIDLFKLDVEGATYEVLEGAGSRIKDIKSFQIESETTEVWKDQYQWDDVCKLLEKNNFSFLWGIKYGNIQCDSIWVQKKYILG